MQYCAVVLLLFYVLPAEVHSQTDSPFRCDELSAKLDLCLNNNELILKVFNETAKQLEKQCDENKEAAKKEAEKQEMEKKEMQMEINKLRVENEIMKAQNMQCEKAKQIEQAQREQCEKEKLECQLMKGPPVPPALIPPTPEDLTDVVQELRKCEKKVADLLTERAKLNSTLSPLNALQLMNLTTGTYYYDMKNRYSWKEAQELCKSLGLQLASFETPKKLSTFWNSASSFVWGPWTSGSYFGHRPGEFHWGNGQRISSEMWRLGQPDEFGVGKESCVYVYDGALYDEPCTDRNNVICEQPLYQFG